MNRRGYFVMEAIVGIVLLGVIAGALVLTLHAGQVTGERFRNRQLALNRAEAALIALENRRPIGQNVSVEPVEPRTGSLRWVRVVATEGGQRVQLMGLVPAGGVP